MSIQNRSGPWRRGDRGDRKNDRKDKNKEDTKNKDDKKDSKVKEDNDEVKDEDKEENEDEKKESKEGPYQGVPANYLSCFVCAKKMWDGESMNKHVKGTFSVFIKNLKFW